MAYFYNDTNNYKRLVWDEVMGKAILFVEDNFGNIMQRVIEREKQSILLFYMRMVGMQLKLLRVT